MADRIQLRRGTAAQWAANQDKVLLSGEPAAELDQGNKFKIGDGVTPWSQLGYVGGSTNATDIISGTLADARLSANVPLKANLTIINVVDYGADKTGATDSTSAILAADAAAEAGGRDVYFPAGVYRIDGLLRLADTASGAAIRTMRPRRWIGDGAWQDSTASTDVTYRGTVFDCRNNTAPALLLKPRGFFELRGITFWQNGTAHTQPYVKITNTTTHVIGCSFIGHDSKSGATCDQKAIVFGGTTLTAIGNEDDSPFQGYGTTVERCYFDRIQHVATWQIFANDIKFVNNVVWNKCGGDTVFVCNPVVAGQYAAGATIADNTIEMLYYSTWAKLTRAVAWCLRGNGLYDAGTLDATGIVHLTDCPGIRIDCGLMPTYTQLVKTDGISSWVTFASNQGEQTYYTSQHPWKAETAKAGTLTVEGGNNALVVQPPTSFTEADSNAVSVNALSKDGSIVYFRQLRNGTVTLDGTVQSILDAKAWTLRNDGFRRKGDGGNIYFDSGTGGSVNFHRGYRHEIEDHTGADIAHFQSAGVVKFFGLPTSNPNVAGQLWNDNGTIKISS